MAIYHLSAKVISRGAGRSITAAAAYRAGAELYDDRLGMTFDYTHRYGVEYSEILTPQNAPAWAKNRAELYNQVEAAEKRKDAQTGREIEIALPHELSFEQRRDLVKDFVNDNFTKHGMVADVAMHAPHQTHEGDKRNYHAHILLTTREITPDGFSSKKNREWNSKETLEQWRENWANHVNEKLRELGINERVDHRSFEAREIDQTPTIHLGSQATALERQGIETELGNYNREAQQQNQEREQNKRELEAAQAQLEALLQQQAELNKIPALEMVETPGQANTSENEKAQEISQILQDIHGLFSEFIDQQNARDGVSLTQEFNREAEKEGEAPEFSGVSPALELTIEIGEPAQEPERPTNPFNRAAGMGQGLEVEQPGFDLVADIYDKPSDHQREKAAQEIKQPVFEPSQDEQAQEQEREAEQESFAERTMQKLNETKERKKKQREGVEPGRDETSLAQKFNKEANPKNETFAERTKRKIKEAEERKTREREQGRQSGRGLEM